jgi:hypothetical protein
VRADCGRVKGDGGGIVTVSTLVGGTDGGADGGADFDSDFGTDFGADFGADGGADLGGSCFAVSQLQQLLALEEAGEAGEFLSAG